MREKQEKYDVDKVWGPQCPECGGRTPASEVHECPVISAAPISNFPSFVIGQPEYEGTAKSIGGCTCVCGAWVPFGTYHICTEQHYDPSKLWDLTTLSQPDIELHKKIDRLLELAEKADKKKQAKYVASWVRSFKLVFIGQIPRRDHETLDRLVDWVEHEGKD